MATINKTFGVMQTSKNEYTFTRLTYGKLLVLVRALEQTAKREGGNGVASDIYIACYKMLTANDRSGFFDPWA